MRIAVDAMGGDEAPGAVVAGAVSACRDFGVGILLCGDQRIVESELGAHSTRGLPIEVCHASETVGMEDPPTEALRRPDCSLRRMVEAVGDGGAVAGVYAGNTGAGMVLGLHVLGRLPGVERPALAVPIPRPAGYSLLIDAGANVDTRPLHLAQFALMGDAYVRKERGVAAPRIALLANGTEDGKGDARVREAQALLAHLPLNAVGLVEGSDLSRDVADVVVADGFVGNVALKSLEGMGRRIGEELGTAFRANLRGRVAWLLLRPAMQGLRSRLDARETGGALLLGLQGTLVKAHGSSDARAIRNAIGQARRLGEFRMHEAVAQAMEGVAQVEHGEAENGPAPRRLRRFWRGLVDRLRKDESGGDADG